MLVTSIEVKEFTCQNIEQSEAPVEHSFESDRPWNQRNNHHIIRNTSPAHIDL